MGDKPDKPVQRCAFCPRPATTRDHVPPKGLFAERPSNLITVPACKECNQSASVDDEYFRQIAMAYETIGGSPDADPVCAKIVGSFRRKEAGGLRAKFLETVQPVRLLTPSGLYVGRTFAFSLETDRLHKTAIKIVKGLFCHKAGYPLPDGYGALAVTAEAFHEGLSGPDGVRMRRTYLRLQGQQKTEIGNGVFSYCFNRHEVDPNTSFWMLAFYRSIGFVGVTGKNDVLGTEA